MDLDSKIWGNMDADTCVKYIQSGYNRAARLWKQSSGTVCCHIWETII